MKEQSMYTTTLASSLNKGMSFSLALEFLKKGYKMLRAGWNGKRMYIVLQAGYPEGIVANKNTQEVLGVPEGTVVKVRPYLMMVDAQGMLVPWLASQTDLLTDDWEVRLEEVAQEFS